MPRKLARAETCLGRCLLVIADALDGMSRDTARQAGMDRPRPGVVMDHPIEQVLRTADNLAWYLENNGAS